MRCARTPPPPTAHRLTRALALACGAQEGGPWGISTNALIGPGQSVLITNEPLVSIARHHPQDMAFAGLVGGDPLNVNNPARAHSVGRCRHTELFHGLDFVGNDVVGFAGLAQASTAAECARRCHGLTTHFMWGGASGSFARNCWCKSQLAGAGSRAPTTETFVAGSITCDDDR